MLMWMMKVKQYLPYYLRESYINVSNLDVDGILQLFSHRKIAVSESTAKTKPKLMYKETSEQHATRATV